MEQPGPQYDVLSAADQLVHDAQLVPSPITLPPYVFFDLLDLVGQEHERRVVGGIIEPIGPEGRDLAIVLHEKIAVTLPQVSDGLEAPLPLNNPEVNLIRELLAKTASLPFVERTKYEQDRVSFEAALLSRKLEGDPVAYEQMKKDPSLKIYTVRSLGALRYTQALKEYLVEDKLMQQSQSGSENVTEGILDEIYKAFAKRKSIEANPETGKSRLERVKLSGQQLAHLKETLDQINFWQDGSIQSDSIKNLLDGLLQDYPKAPQFEPRVSRLQKIIKKFTGLGK